MASGSRNREAGRMIVVLMGVTGSGISSPSRTRMSRKRETRCSSTSSPPMPAKPTRPPAFGGRSRTNSWTSSRTRRSTRFEPSWSTRFSRSVDSSLSSSAPRNHPLKSYCRPEISPRCKPTWTSTSGWGRVDYRNLPRQARLVANRDAVLRWAETAANLDFLAEGLAHLPRPDTGADLAANGGSASPGDLRTIG